MFNKEKFSNILNKINSTYNTMTDFAKKASFDRTYISKYINMKLDNPPTPKILQKLADASNGITSYAELMLICDYLHDDFDKLMGDSITVYNNPYTANLKYNGSENFIFDVLYSFENLNVLEYTDEEKAHITRVYNYIINNKDYDKLIEEYKQLKKKYNDQIKQEFEFAYHKEMEGLSDEEIADALRFYKQIKYGNKENKSDN